MRKRRGIGRKIAGLPGSPRKSAFRTIGQFLARWSDTGLRAARALRSSSTTVNTIPGGPPGDPDGDGDRFIEIWNLVFMQFEQDRAGASASRCRAPSIDTGMGLERVAKVLQGKARQLRHRFDARPHHGVVRRLRTWIADGQHAVSHRVIADHLRASSFLIADGVCCPRRTGAATCCAGSCDAPCAMPISSAAPSPWCGGSSRRWCSQMGVCLIPSLVRAQPLITETLKVRGDRKFQADARARPAPPRRAARRARTGAGQASSPGSVAFKPLRHFRLPARSDPGRLAGARHG